LLSHTHTHTHTLLTTTTTTSAIVISIIINSFKDPRHWHRDIHWPKHARTRTQTTWI